MSDRLDLNFGHNEIDHGTSDDYYTPPFIFEALGLHFDLDVCSPPNGAPWIPANAFLSPVEDGLATDWHGKVWMNPPYSRPAPWVEKWQNHGNGIGLVPVSKSGWYNKMWQNPEVVLIPMPVNLKFMKPSGEASQIFMPIVLIGIGADNIKAMRLSGLGRVR